MGGCDLLKYNGGDSGIKISVLYWRCSLIRVSVIRGSTVVGSGSRSEPVAYPAHMKQRSV
jgi:hypothetical protein